MKIKNLERQIAYQGFLIVQEIIKFCVVDNLGHSCRLV